MNSSKTKSVFLPSVAGVWRRLAAFAVDCGVVAILGLVIGSLLFDWLASIGGYARLVGFAVVLTYFGVLNSKLMKGQTLGKYMFSISVRSASGAYISLPVSLLRAAIIATPWMLNGAPIPTALLFSVAGLLISLLIFGVALASAYLFLFNQSGRQVLHDLVCNTYVVRNKANPYQPLPLNKKHGYAVVALFVASLLVPVFSGALAKTDTFAELLRLQKLVNDIDDVNLATVSFGTTTELTTDESYTTVSVALVVKQKSLMTEGYARDVAQYVISNSGPAASRDKIYTNVSYGYDMGIASSWSGKGIWLNIAR